MSSVVRSACLAAVLAPMLAAQSAGDPRPRLPAGSSGFAAAAAVDLDGDGRVDLLRGEGSRLWVLRQDVAGNFAPFPGQPEIDFGTAGRVTCIASGRLDSDAQPDVFVGLSSGTDAVLVNLGGGRLQRASPDPLPPAQGRTTRWAGVADLDRDGRDDLVLNTAVGGIRLLLQSSSGAFVDGTGGLPVAALGSRDALALTDVDADGDVDIVLGAGFAAAAVLLRNDGRGDFRLGVVSLPIRGGVSGAVAAGDVTGDRATDLVFAAAVQPTVELLIGDGRGGFVVAPSGAFPARPVGGLHLADVDADGRADALVRTADGDLVLGRSTGTGGFGTGRPLLVGDPRAALVVVDLEPDGDVDLWAPGGDGADRLLVGDGRGGFVGGEDATVPRGAVDVPYSLAIVDVTGEGDLDIVRVGRDGTLRAMVQDGGARFRPRVNAPFPTLPPNGFYSDVGAGRLAAGGAARDLFVLGVPGASNPTGLRVFAWQAGRYSDVSAGVVPTLSARGPTAMAVGAFGRGARGDDATDVVIGDASGALWFLLASGGALRELSAAFTPVGGGAIGDILPGDFDGDGQVDFVALHAAGPPALHLARAAATSPTFDWIGRATVGVPVADAGAVVDLDGDGRDDLVLATPSRAEGATVLLSRNGVFLDATANWLRNTGALPGIEALAVATTSGRATLTVASPAAGVMRLTVGNGVFDGLARLALHGGAPIVSLHAADLDGDGDEDLVVTRRAREPAVVLDGRVSLLQLGLGQNGRALRLGFGAPPGSVAALLFSPLTSRTPIPGIGTLRLVSPATLAVWPTPPSGRFVEDLPIPPGFGAAQLPLQLATLDFATGRARLGNLEIAVVTDH